MPQLGLSPIEEAFFRAGDAMSDASASDGVEDDGPPPTLWQSVIGWLRGAAIGRTATSQF